MPTSTSLTIDLPADVQEKLDQISSDTRRSIASLAAEAIAAYADHELALIEEIKLAREDIAAGRLIPHEQAMDEVEAVIAEAEARLKARA
nr:CopG family transcriptional regulator [uncultured Devosia sp.]